MTEERLSDGNKPPMPFDFHGWPVYKMSDLKRYLSCQKEDPRFGIFFNTRSLYFWTDPKTGLLESFDEYPSRDYLRKNGYYEL